MGIQLSSSNKINKKSRHDIKLMRQAGLIVAQVHALMREMAKPGVSTLALDAAAESLIRKAGALPTFKGYHGFPATLCTSVNDQVVHGIPTADAILKDGDIISVDVGATYQGMVADAALTIPIGTVAEATMQVVKATEEALYAAIDKARAGNYLEDVSGAVEDTNIHYNFGLVKEYGGHSVGYKLHEEPFIHNYRTGVKGPILQAGNTLAIEPMFCMSTDKVITLEDGWTVVTTDGSPSAHFEHTILITENGAAEILTCLPEGPFRYFPPKGTL